MDRLKYLVFFIAVVLAGATLTTSCIEDGVTTSPSAQPAFSVDTLHMGTVFTDEVTTTHRFTVYNRNNKGIVISDIHVSGENAGLFRLNVDGISGERFSDVEIRAKDSIFVMVEATLPENHSDLPIDIDATVDFVTNGTLSQVTVAATGQDVTRLRGFTVESDTQFSAGKPYQIFDSLVVAPNATLTLPAGTRL